ncbi:hypothetical protein WHX56_11050 [Achromobacter veterisilvae]|uniref:Uncharacterized protein n=1 Tax=Achromobacter veterisilvae TaxID=2069367 RepID=A0ABZ2S4W2_9BURK
MKKCFSAGLMAIAGSVLAPAAAMAFGEAGQWSSGWGQGVSEYTAVDAKKNALYIACSEDRPVAMTLTVAGQEYGGDGKDFSLIIDGKEISQPYETSSRVGANNFYFAWDAMRKAKRLEARTSDGKVVNLPVKGIAKALPSTQSKGFPCQVDF